MKNFILGIVFGIVLTTIGVDGVIRWIDIAVSKTQNVVENIDAESK
jgi:hypothetical protein